MFVKNEEIFFFIFTLLMQAIQAAERNSYYSTNRMKRQIFLLDWNLFFSIKVYVIVIHQSIQVITGYSEFYPPILLPYWEFQHQNYCRERKKNLQQDTSIQEEYELQKFIQERTSAVIKHTKIILSWYILEYKLQGRHRGRSATLNGMYKCNIDYSLDSDDSGRLFLDSL